MATNLYATGTDETIIRNICRRADVEVSRAHHIKPSTALVQPPMQNLMKVFAKVQQSGKNIARRSAAAKPSEDSVTRIK